MPQKSEPKSPPPPASDPLPTPLGLGSTTARQCPPCAGTSTFPSLASAGCGPAIMMENVGVPTIRDALGLFFDALYLIIFLFARGCGAFGYISSPECYARACSGLQPKASSIIEENDGASRRT